MAMSRAIAKTSNLPEGQMQLIEVDGQPLLLMRVAGEFYAVGGLCPHRSAPLIQGWLRGTVLECPWHHYCYDIRSGENLYPRNVYPADLPHLQQDLQPLRCYPVRVDADTLWLEEEGVLYERESRMDASRLGDALE